MADTFTQIYVHIVFAVKGKENLISSSHKDELYRYITGIVTNKEQKLIAINGMPNHIHVLVGLKPTVALSDLVRDIKANSSRFINENHWVRGTFEWQRGFGAFSCGHSQLDAVVQYIRNQEEHHRIKTFREEYIEFLNRYAIGYKPEYLPEDV